MAEREATALTAGRLPAETRKQIRNATCCSRYCTRCRSASAGSARAPSNYVSVRLDIPPAETYGVASFYGMFSLQPRPMAVAHVCDDIACMTRGAEELCDQLENRLGPEGVPCAGGRATWLRSNCLGLCERAPAVMVARAGKKAQERVLAPANADRVQSLINDAANDVMPAAPDVLNPQLSVPQEGSRKLALLRRVGKVNAPQLDGYQRLGGYEALRKAIQMGAADVLKEIAASKLLGPWRRGFSGSEKVGSSVLAARPAQARPEPQALPHLQC